MLVVVGLLLLACAYASVWATGAQAAKPRSPTLAPNDTVIDGPDGGIDALNGMSVSRDGNGGLIYTKSIAGVAHVFVSRLINGAYQAPVQADAGLLGPSSEPVIAAGQDGLLVIAFINAGQLYVTTAPDAGTSLSAPQAIYGAARNPSVSISNFGKAYVVFTATDGGGGGDVRAAYYYGGQWALETTPLDDNPADAAGLGTGRPAVTTAGDGVAIVAWGENGHIYTRKVTKTAASPVDEQADIPSLNGAVETSAADPVIAAGGDSTYASVAFTETFGSGASQQTRVLTNRLHGSQYDGIEQPDGLATPGSQSSSQASTAVNEYGAGWVTSQYTAGHELVATTLAGNERFGQILRVDSLPNSNAPDAVPAVAGLVSTFIAWQQTPGVSGPAEIRLRYAPNGGDLGPEQVISTPSDGASNADQGLAAAGDVAGDATAAWVQGSGPSTEIVAAQLFQPPGGFSISAKSFTYSRTARPLLSWSPASELWGSPTYTVRIGGAAIGQTQSTSLVPPAPLLNGRQSYQVTAANAAGLTSTTAPATVFVDTVAPKGSLKFSGTDVIHKPVRLRVTYSDTPPAGQPRSAASGVKTVTVKWGDGTRAARIPRNSAAHIYTRRRTFTVVVTVTDRAGNVTVVKHRLTIRLKAPAAKKKRKKKGAQ